MPVLLEGGFEQPHLPLHRIAGPGLVRRKRRRINVGVEAADLIVEFLGPIDQPAQALGQ